MLKKGVLLFLIINFSTEAAAQNLWQTITYMGNIREIKVTDGILWSATGGGVLKHHIESGENEKITHIEGLSSNNLTTIDVDAEGKLWFVTATGDFNVFSPQSREWEIIREFSGRIISDIFIRGDSIWVGTDQGVSFYLIDRAEIKESYKSLGIFPRNTTVQRILLNGNQIWVGTDQGIATADIRHPNLIAPDGWNNFSTAEGLPDNQIQDLTVLNNKLFVATNKGVAFYENAVWTTTNDGLFSLIVNRLEGIEDQLYAGTAVGVYRLDKTNMIWSRIGPFISQVSALAYDDLKTLWIGRTNNGISFLPTDSTHWKNVELNDPGASSFSDLALSKNGILWCASGGYRGEGGQGFYRYDTVQKKWRNYIGLTPGLGDNALTVEVDNEDNAWIGEWGGGGFIISSNGDTVRSLNDHLSAFDNTGFTVVTDINYDLETKAMWFTVAEPQDNKIIAVLSSDTWFYFTNNKMPAGNNKPVKTIIDNRGRVWFGVGFYGVDAQGVAILDYNQTLDNLADDTWEYLSTSNGLLSSDITALASELDGNVWIGTISGLNFYDNESVSTISELEGQRINGIEIDYQGNKWFATNAGLSMLSTEGDWTYYTKENSEIVSNNVLSVLHDEKTGELYAGTSTGLSILQTQFIRAKQQLESIEIYPNPWHSNPNDPSYVQFLTIDGLAENSSVSILDINGKFIRHFPVSETFGRKAFWDGFNEFGDAVSSGIYIIVVKTENGQIQKGKAAIVN